MLLIICRHAKSDWDDLSITDFNRTLNKRGLKSSKAMGVFLKSLNLPIDCMISSSAIRAKTTAHRIAGEICFDKKQVILENQLYLADVEPIMKNIEHHAKDKKNVVVFGHNPGLTELVNFFGVRLDNLPTNGMVAFEMEGNDWTDLHLQEPKYLWHKFPRELK